MRKFKVIALSVGGKNKVLHSGQEVTEMDLVSGTADNLIRGKFLEEIIDTKAVEKARKDAEKAAKKAKKEAEKAEKERQEAAQKEAEEKAEQVKKEQAEKDEAEKLVANDVGSEGSDDAGSEGSDDAGSEGSDDAGSEGSDDAGSEGSDDAGSDDAGDIKSDIKALILDKSHEDFPKDKLVLWCTQCGISHKESANRRELFTLLADHLNG